MSTGENQPSLYGAVYNAMTDPELIGDLLRHPEFRSQAKQVCDRLAGRAGGEELLQEACLRLVERAGQLKPDLIRNEGEFFRWFSQLARRVHLSRVLSAAAVGGCTRKADGWPDAPADVPPDDIGRFLAHADACPYHTRRLREGDERLRAIFRRARGLNHQGRIPHGDELRASIDDHKRRLQSWRDTAFKKDGQFGPVSLYNGDREVATCGERYDFSNKVSRNELDPYAGLQIRGLNGSNPDESVLLGFYALASVRHDGAEQTLKLDNGYVVCLKVNQVGETTYEIHFRCVETKALEAERAAAAEDGSITEVADRKYLDGSAPSPPFLPPDMPPPTGPAGWWPPPPVWRASAMAALLLLVAVACFQVGRRWGQPPAGNKLLGQAMESPAAPPPPARVSTATEEELNPHAAHCCLHQGSGAAASAGRSTQAAAQAALTSRSAEHRRAGGRGTHARRVGLSLNTEAAVRHFSKGLFTGEWVVVAMPHQPAIAERSFTDEVEDLRATPYRLRSYDERAVSADNSGRARAGGSLRNASYGGWVEPAQNSVLHFATNDKLIGTVKDELKVIPFLRIEPVTEQEPETEGFSVAWVVRTTKSEWAGRSFEVKLDVYIYRKGEKKSAFHDSYKGEGRSLDAAYGDAVGKAVKPVINWIGEDGEGRPGTLVVEKGGVEQPVADAPEEGLTVDNRDAVIQPNRPERDIYARYKDGDVEPEETEEQYREE